MRSRAAWVVTEGSDDEALHRSRTCALICVSTAHPPGLRRPGIPRVDEHVRSAGRRRSAGPSRPARRSPARRACPRAFGVVASQRLFGTTYGSDATNFSGYATSGVPRRLARAAAPGRSAGRRARRCPPGRAGGAGCPIRTRPVPPRTDTYSPGRTLTWRMVPADGARTVQRSRFALGFVEVGPGQLDVGLGGLDRRGRHFGVVSVLHELLIGRRRGGGRVALVRVVGEVLLGLGLDEGGPCGAQGGDPLRPPGPRRCGGRSRPARRRSSPPG